MNSDRFPSRIRICEMSPRDGIQSLRAEVPTAVKLELIRRLTDAGLDYIESASFVSPKWVPQMADAAEVCAGLERRPGITHAVLAPNLKGLERAHAAGMTEVGVFSAASQTFSQKNTNCSIEESLQRAETLMAEAQRLGIRGRGYISCIAVCPYEGETDPATVARLARALVGMGCYEIALGETIGAATPLQARRVVQAVAEAVPGTPLGLHFHDTRGQALANILACLDLGVASIDGSVGGIGGCPYAPGAAGNVATEDLVYMLQGLGIDTGIDLDALCTAGRYICEAIGRPVGSRVSQALACAA